MASEVEILRQKIRDAAAATIRANSQAEGSKSEAAPRPSGSTRETPGRLGVVSPARRAKVREFVRSMDTPGQLAAEATPAITGTGIGTIAGGTLGTALGGPPGTFVGSVVGGAAGGVLGELLGQETGVSPEDDLALQLSAVPLGLGPAAGGAAKLGRRAAVSGFENLPSVQAALGRMARQRAADEFESFGTQIVAGKHGLLKEDADKILAVAREVGGTIPVESFEDTLDVIGRYTNTYGKFANKKGANFSEARAALQQMDTFLEGLLVDGAEIGTDDLIILHKLVNRMAIAGQRSGSLKSEGAQEVFEALNRDLERIGQEVPESSAGLIKAASDRANLDFVIQGVERKVSEFTHAMPGSSDTEFDVGGFRDWINAATNPKSRTYDKKLAEQLKDELPQIKQTLDNWTKFTENSKNPAGPGSIVIRGIGARTGAGLVGWVLGGPVGAGAGAVVGARLPEMMTNVLLHPKGRAFMTAVVNAGKGAVRQDRWQVATQMATQAVTRPVIHTREEENLRGD